MKKQIFILPTQHSSSFLFLLTLPLMSLRIHFIHVLGILCTPINKTWNKSLIWVVGLNIIFLRNGKKRVNLVMKSWFLRTKELLLSIPPYVCSSKWTNFLNYNLISMAFNFELDTMGLHTHTRFCWLYF